MKGLSNLQFITMCIVVMVCGLAIVGHESFKDGKDMAYDSIALAYRNAEEKAEQEKAKNGNNTESEQENVDNEKTEEDDYETDGSETPGDASASGDYSHQGDTSRNISKSAKKYNYIGWLKIPKMGLYKGFLANRKNNLYCVDHDICSYSWEGNSPKSANSKLVIGAHNGVNNNAYFRGIEVLKTGDHAYIEYKGKSYKYELIKKYRNSKSKHSIKTYSEPGKELYLFTCAKENHYTKNYLVMRFKIVSEEDM